MLFVTASSLCFTKNIDIGRYRAGTGRYLVIDNRSPHWHKPHYAQPEREADLFAVLDGADVSEPVRAAVAHALKRPPQFPRQSGPTWPEQTMHTRYTLHLTFPAANLDEARAHAVTYAEGLSLLRPEVGEHAPLLSRADTWNHIEPLFCGAIGPDEEVCADVREHPGFHRAAGLGGLSWGGSDGIPGIR
jgi:hypothetical protein